jgi:hypothetical protein
MLGKTNNKTYDSNYDSNYDYIYNNNSNYNYHNVAPVLERFYQAEIIKLQNELKELKTTMQIQINQTQIQLSQLINSIQKREEELTCCVCMIEKKTYANMNCCHMCVCENCSYSLGNKCPLCRTIGVFKKIIV